MELKNPSSPIFPKIGGAKEKIKEKKRQIRKRKRKRNFKLKIKFYSVSNVSGVYLNKNV